MTESELIRVQVAQLRVNELRVRLDEAKYWHGMKGHHGYHERCCGHVKSIEQQLQQAVEGTFYQSEPA